MSYEIIYHYRKKISKDEYSDEIETNKVIVGELGDNVKLEIVAGRVMAMLAHRKILVEDVEIYEFTKKKLSFKFADEGILISNRKFKFVEGPPALEVVTATVDSAPDAPNTIEQLSELLLQNPKLLEQLKGSAGVPVIEAKPAKPTIETVKAKPKVRIPIKWEVYDPIDEQMHMDLRSKGKVFTVEKSYPVLEEKVAGQGILYATVDDTGKEVWVSDKYFNLPFKDSAPDAGDFFREDTAPPPTSKFRNRKKKSDEVSLQWGELYEGDLPEIR